MLVENLKSWREAWIGLIGYMSSRFLKYKFLQYQ